MLDSVDVPVVDLVDGLGLIQFRIHWMVLWIPKLWFGLFNQMSGMYTDGGDSVKDQVHVDAGIRMSPWILSVYERRR